MKRVVLILIALGLSPVRAQDDFDPCVHPAREIKLRKGDLFPAKCDSLMVLSLAKWQTLHDDAKYMQDLAGLESRLSGKLGEQVQAQKRAVDEQARHIRIQDSLLDVSKINVDKATAMVDTAVKNNEKAIAEIRVQRLKTILYSAFFLFAGAGGGFVVGKAWD
jgi:hypothetical protein